MLHGDAGVELAQKATAALFSKAGLDASGLSAREWLGVFANLPMTEVPRSEFEAGVNLLDLAVRCKAFDNKGNFVYVLFSFIVLISTRLYW
jgi:hypothetical protein